MLKSPQFLHADNNSLKTDMQILNKKSLASEKKNVMKIISICRE